MLLQAFVGVTALVNFTACASNLDDPFGAKARRAEERRAECQQVYEITKANYDQSRAVYDHADVRPTQADSLKRAEIYIATASSLDALPLGDQNLNLLKGYLAESFRHDAERYRALAPFAEAERNLTSANDRSEAHQTVIARENPYVGLEYAIEVYCEGGDMQSAPL